MSFLHRFFGQQDDVAERLRDETFESRHAAHQLQGEPIALDPHPLVSEFFQGPGYKQYCQTCRAYVCTTCGSRIIEGQPDGYFGALDWCPTCAGVPYPN